MSKDIRNLSIIFIVALFISVLFYKFVATENKPDSTQVVNADRTPLRVVNDIVASHSYSYGPLDAKVTVVEFFDPECETCAQVSPYIENEIKYYVGKVRWVFRYMAYHKNSRNAIRVLEAARKQNLFLEVQHALFENQKIWGEQQISTEKQILEIAAQIKSLKMNQLKKDMSDSGIEEIINTDISEGTKAGVRGTPTFFVNGELLEELNLDMLIKKINEQLLSGSTGP